ncbi:hypothetical protein TNCT_396451 [Trichonephila clavata]|uniref:Uncharacterized protein n=1 Tax=Trichonephila clavata TaxID=2740835 RepID=A0A8X6G1B6_TRICU|nr:hypothetical protein TNCT_396451 [Trichonephila clavata]
MSILVKKLEERGEVKEKRKDLRTNTKHEERKNETTSKTFRKKGQAEIDQQKKETFRREEYTGDSESEEKIRKKTQRPTKRRERPRIPSALHSSEETVEKLKGRPSAKSIRKDHTFRLQNDTKKEI